MEIVGTRRGDDRDDVRGEKGDVRERGWGSLRRGIRGFDRGRSPARGVWDKAAGAVASEEIEDGALHGDECGFKIREDAVGGVFEALRRFRTHSRGERVRGAALASSDGVDAGRELEELMSSWG